VPVKHESDQPERALRGTFCLIGQSSPGLVEVAVSGQLLHRSKALGCPGAPTATAIPRAIGAGLVSQAHCGIDRPP